jgi:uncharacterized CHY-type Zn-finger protein
MAANKKTHTQISEAVAEHGFELQSTYINSRTKLDILCINCNNIFNRTWNEFNKGRHCPQCNKKPNPNKKTHATIAKNIKKLGYLLKSTYIGNKEDLKIYCYDCDMTPRTKVRGFFRLTLNHGITFF